MKTTNTTQYLTFVASEYFSVGTSFEIESSNGCLHLEWYFW